MVAKALDQIVPMQPIPSFGSSPWFMEKLRQLRWEKRNVECCWHSIGDEPDQIRVKALQGILQGLPFDSKHQYFPIFILSVDSHLAALFHVILPSWVKGAQGTPCRGVQKNLFSICQSYWYSLTVGFWPCCRSRGGAWSVWNQFEHIGPAKVYRFLKTVSLATCYFNS